MLQGQIYRSQRFSSAGCLHILEHVAAVVGAIAAPPHAAAAPGHEYQDPRHPATAFDTETSSDDGAPSTDDGFDEEGDPTFSPLNVERAFFTSWLLYGDYLHSCAPEIGPSPHAEFATTMSHILPALRHPPSATIPGPISVETTQQTLMQELRKDVKNAADANDAVDAFEPASQADTYPRIPVHLLPPQSVLGLLEAWVRTGICHTHAGDINREQLLFLTLFAIHLQDISPVLFSVLVFLHLFQHFHDRINYAGAPQCKASAC
jgi:hypothetical protein